MFITEKLNDNITRIKDLAGTCMYLVEGDERAVLIDTGVGAGSLKAVIDRLTQKPLTVIITHGHVDHAMGSAEFDDVYMNLEDTEVYKHHSDLDNRIGYIKSSAFMSHNPQLAANISEKDMLPVKPVDEFKDMKPGDVFDLGGISIKILEGKGHTPGTITILLPELRILILGDACNTFTFLFEPTSSTVEEYREMLLKLKAETDGKYDNVVLLHGPGGGPVDLIESVMDVCQDVMNGVSDRILFESLGCQALIAKAMNFEIFSRADGGSGNVVYREDGVFRN